MPMLVCSAPVGRVKTPAVVGATSGVVLFSSTTKRIVVPSGPHVKNFFLDLYSPWDYTVDMAKTKEERTHAASIRVRLLPEHDALIREAAERALQRKGSGNLSDWIRETLVAAARRELKRGEVEG